MNKKMDSLDRLFRSASSSWERDIGLPSYGLEMRVMSAWNGIRAGDESADLTWLFRRGVVVAMGLAFVMVMASLAQNPASSADEWEFSGMVVQFVALR